MFKSDLGKPLLNDLNSAAMSKTASESSLLQISLSFCAKTSVALQPPKAFFDEKLMEFDQVWGAAGTPRHVFSASPKEIQQTSSAQLSDFII